MYFTDDIDGGIELDWCLRWKREILGWNDGMAVGWVGLYGEGKRNHLLHFGTETVSPIRMHSFIFHLSLFYRRNFLTFNRFILAPLLFLIRKAHANRSI